MHLLKQDNIKQHIIRNKGEKAEDKDEKVQDKMDKQLDTALESVCLCLCLNIWR